MSDLDITPFTPEDDAAALALENRCTQGTSLKIKFRRTTFRARSELYENAVIYCARRGGEIIGVAAGALKTVHLHGASVRALYGYDLRVHPDHRNEGVGKRLSAAVLADIGRNADCIYTLVNGQNEPALGLVRRNFSPRVEIPLTYVLIPVPERIDPAANWRITRRAEIRNQHARRAPEIEFVPDRDETRMAGFVAGLSLTGRFEAGCSLWSNERILAEQVVAVPVKYRILRMLSPLARPFMEWPPIPRPGEIVRSWFLFDIFAEGGESVKQLLDAAKRFARSCGRTYLYALLQNDDPLLDEIRRSGTRMFTFPYLFLAKGGAVPDPTDHLYLDVRDL